LKRESFYLLELEHMLRTIFIPLLLFVWFSCFGQGNLGRTRLTDMIELPAYSNGKYKEQFAVRYRYTVSYNSKYRIPNWVAWKQTIYNYIKAYPRKESAFDNDDAIQSCPTHGHYDRKYTYGMVHRGHMCPHDASSWEEEARNSVHCMSNIAPQTPMINNGIWKRLEEKCKKWNNDNFVDLYIVCGPILNTITDFIKFPDNTQPIGIPRKYFKAILGRKGNGSFSGIAYIINNYSGKTEYSTIDDIENETGYNLFHNLPDDIERQVESMVQESDWPDWSLGGKATLLNY